MRLEGKVALVTGAGHGIGRAIALAFAREGADIGVNALHQESSEATAQDARALGRRALAVPADVTQADQVDAMVDTVLDKLGRIDILVNNAGGTPRLFLMLDYPVEEWDHAISLNLRSAFLCSRKVGKFMTEQKGGKILNISSGAGYAGIPLRSAYGPAKAGMMNLTMVMAAELGQYNINVNCIAPGVVLTTRIKGLIEKGAFGASGLELLKNKMPLGRLCEPEDVANAAVFLVSDEAGAITGVVLPVDAGMSSYKPLT